jgi:voltage-gated potassium channel
MLRSVASIEQGYTQLLVLAQRIITIIFSAEYILRIRISKKPKKYIFSFFGIIDFLAILPSFLSFIVAGHSLMMLRALRLLRLFRVFKLWKYTSASSLLWNSLKASSAKITVFLLTVFIIVLIVWTLIYLIESPSSWFDSIPTWVYRAIVTITTVWYGDITPVTPVWQLLSATLMILWYAIIAVPTGLVTAQLVEEKHKKEKDEKKKEKKRKKK